MTSQDRARNAVDGPDFVTLVGAGEAAAAGCCWCDLASCTKMGRLFGSHVVVRSIWETRRHEIPVVQQGTGNSMYSDDDFSRRPADRPYSVSIVVLVWLMILYHSFCTSVNVSALLRERTRIKLYELYHFPRWVIPAVTVCFFLNAVWSFGLMHRKKWAFYAMLVTSLCLGAIPLVGGNGEKLLTAWRAGALLTWDGLGQLLDYPLVSIIALLVLFVLLRKGGPRCGWNQLQ